MRMARTEHSFAPDRTTYVGLRRPSTTAALLPHSQLLSFVQRLAFSPSSHSSCLNAADCKSDSPIHCTSNLDSCCWRLLVAGSAVVSYQEVPQDAALKARSQARVLSMLGAGPSQPAAEDLGIFGLGNTRTLAAFLKFCDVDFACRWDSLPLHTNSVLVHTQCI